MFHQFGSSFVFLFHTQEEQRLKAKKAKEELQHFLEDHDKINSNVRYR